MLDLTRRRFMIALILAASFAAVPAFAKDGDSNSGSGGGDSGNSGSGSDNSGSDNDGDDDDDDSERDEDSGNSTSGSSSAQVDQNRAMRAVKDGKAVSLKQLKSYLIENYPGEILHVSLRRRSGEYFYRVRILSTGNRIRSLSLNAVTLKPGAV